MSFEPLEFLRRDLERISRALGPGTLPATVRVAGRDFRIDYIGLREAKGEPGLYLAEIVVTEEGRGSVGGTSLVLNPKEKKARIDYASVAHRRIGLGRAMLQAVERDLRARGYDLIELLAVSDSIPFWKRLGYQPEKEEIPGEGLEMWKFL